MPSWRFRHAKRSNDEDHLENGERWRESLLLNLHLLNEREHTTKRRTNVAKSPAPPLSTRISETCRPDCNPLTPRENIFNSHRTFPSPAPHIPHHLTREPPPAPP